MPKTWPQAALQAQAIAARTYALKKYGLAKEFDVNALGENGQVVLRNQHEKFFKITLASRIKFISTLYDLLEI